MAISSIVPNAEEFIKLPVDERAWVVITEAGGASARNLHLGNFLNPNAHHVRDGYPAQRHQAVEAAVISAFRWVENQGYLSPEGSSPDFLQMSPQGAEWYQEVEKRGITPRRVRFSAQMVPPGPAGPSDELVAGGQSPDQPDVELANLGRIAELRFKKRATDLYDAVIRDTQDLVDQWSKEGIASTGKYVRKVADAILAQFETIEQLFEETYIGQFRNTPVPRMAEQWLREKVKDVVESEVARAEEVTKRLCSSFAGAVADTYRAYVVRLQDEGRSIQQRLGDAITLLILTANAGTSITSTATASPADESPGKIVEPTLMVFVSHSSADADLALALVELLRAALDIAANQIRCTSVNGYRLPAGAHFETQLRAEVTSAKVLIGLITPNSLASAYVPFELGARWGAGLHMVPVLAGIEPKALRGPLTALNALACESEGQLHQLVEDIAKALGRRVQGVSSYTRYVSKLAQLSRTREPASNALSEVTTDAAEPAQPARIQRLIPNLIVTDARKTSIVQRSQGLCSERVWVTPYKSVTLVSQEPMGYIVERHEESSSHPDSEEDAIVAQFTNEAREGHQNVGALVKAQLVYRDGERELRRIIGCWLNQAADMVEFRVDETHGLILGLILGGQFHTCAKRRVRVDLNADEIPMDLEPLTNFQQGTVSARLTNADTGDFLCEARFRLTVNPLNVILE